MFVTIRSTSLFALALCIMLAWPAQAGKNRPLVTILPLPSRDVAPPDQDLVLANLATQIRKRYNARVLSGRAIGRAVWGTMGSGLEENVNSFMQKVARGKKAYQQLQIGKALKTMGQAHAPLVFAGAEIRKSQSLVDMHLYSGLSYLAKGKKAQAADEFRQAVAFDNKATLSARQFPPDVVKEFKKAKRALLSGNPTSMEIVSKPSGASVIFDGKRQGQTPLRLPVYPGYHFVAIEHDGYSPWTLNLPNGIAPKKLRARLIKEWTGDPPEDLVATAIAREDLSESVRARLRLLAGFYSSDAILLVSTNRDGANIHLGMRLYVVNPEIVTRARLFNLGSKKVHIQKKIKGIVATLKSLRQAKPRAAAAVVATGPVVAPLPKPKPRPTPVTHQPVVVAPINPVVPIDEQGKNDPIPGYTPWYKTWWFWTVTGVLVAGGVAAGVGVYMTQPDGSWTLTVQPN